MIAERKAVSVGAQCGWKLAGTGSEDGRDSLLHLQRPELVLLSARHVLQVACYCHPAASICAS